MLEFKKLKEKEVLSETQYYTIEKIVGNKVQLKTDIGEDIIVSKDYLEKLVTSASQFTDTKKVTRTELVDIFLTSPRMAMTVNFNKKVKEADIKKAIVDLYPNKGGKLVSESEFKKKVSSALNLKGEERVMKGRHYGNQDANGRVNFIDMEVVKDTTKDYDTRSRLVDPRTLNWIIVGNVKYEVK